MAQETRAKMMETFDDYYVEYNKEWNKKSIEEKMKGLEGCKAFLETKMGKLTDEEYLAICECTREFAVPGIKN